MQYYRLKDNYVLRGWDKLPYAVADTSTGNAKFLTAKQFQAIELCDGSVDVSMPFIPDEFRQVISDAEERGFVEKCEAGQGISESQQYRKYSSRYIRSVEWSITGRCNYKCRHCYMSAPEPGACELPHESVMGIVNQLAECGVMTVELTGGEPLIRPDFLEIVDALRERNILIEKIKTNGALVSEKLLHELDRRNVHPEFQISYDGKGMHDWMRGLAGAEKSAECAFRLCRDMGFRTMAGMILHRRNMHILRETVNHLASLGVGKFYATYTAALGEWKTRSDNQTISFSELFQAFLDYIPHYYEDGMPMQIFLMPFFFADPKYPDEYEITAYTEAYDPEGTLLCGLARSSAYISPEGRVLMSAILAGMEIQKDYPALSEKSFSECVSAPEYMKILDMTASDFLKVNDECRNCRFTKHCYAACRWSAMAENEGSLLAKSPIMCELYYGGWIKKIADTMKRLRPSAECPVKDTSLL